MSVHTSYIKKIFCFFLFFYLSQQAYPMEEECLSDINNTLNSNPLYFPFCDTVELAHKNGFTQEDCEIIKEYVKKGADPNWKVGENDQPLLNLAIKKQNKDLLTFLLQHNADINAGEKRGLAPIHCIVYAPAHNKVEIDIKDLIEQRANVNAMGNKGITPLHLAATFGNIDCINYLTEYGANINQRNLHGYTSLAMALISPGISEAIKIKVIETLCNVGASLLDVSEQHDTAFHMVIGCKMDKSTKDINSIITHARCDAFDKGSKQIIPYALWILKYWEISNKITFPIER